jgi:hypothetical protein
MSPLSVGRFSFVTLAANAARFVSERNQFAMDSSLVQPINENPNSVKRMQKITGINGEVDVPIAMR